MWRFPSPTPSGFRRAQYRLAPVSVQLWGNSRGALVVYSTRLGAPFIRAFLILFRGLDPLATSSARFFLPKDRAGFKIVHDELRSGKSSVSMPRGNKHEYDLVFWL